MGYKRIEITVHTDELQRLDQARGFEPRASFVKRALGEALNTGDHTFRPRLDEALASLRAGRVVEAEEYIRMMLK